MKLSTLPFRIRLFATGHYFNIRQKLKSADRRPAGAGSVGKLFLYYRISDHGYKKDKLPCMTKENCLANAVEQFPLSEVEWLVLADNVSESTYAMILKYVPAERVRRVSVGHGAGTFRMVYDEALRQPDDSIAYFLEDDYLHRPRSLECLMEAARAGIADYLTLYDHPDKYAPDSPNPFVAGGSERSRVFFTGTCHWKLTNSTTMTFAARVSTLRRDKKYFWRWTTTSHPYDFHIFWELGTFARRTLASPIPSLSTHGDLDCLAPGIDWNNPACQNNEART